MNIVFFIGNGFDINLGLKTSYQDFYKYYKKQKSTSDAVSVFKNAIDPTHETWSDLEQALGKFTSSLNNKQEFFEVFEDVVQNLSTFIGNQEFEIEQFSNISNKVYSGLVRPEKSLSGRQNAKIGAILNQTDRKTSVITLNYTRMLERVLAGYTQKVKIEHVHGFANERMVLGVNDTSQIANTVFQGDRQITNALVKEDCNFSMDHGVEDVCKAMVSQADLFCIFGCSIGSTDMIWWNNIADRLCQNNSSALIIFIKTEAIHPLRLYETSDRVEEIKTQFMKKLSPTLGEEEVEVIKNKIFVAINSDIFNVKIKRRVQKIKPTPNVLG